MDISTSIPVKALQPLQAEREAKPMDPDDTEVRQAQLRKKSSELEAVFLTQLIKSMEKTIPEGLGGGKNTLSSMMFSSVMGEAMSRGGGIGLSKMIFESLKRSDQDLTSGETGGNEYLQTLEVMQQLRSFEEPEE